MKKIKCLVFIIFFIICIISISYSVTLYEFQGKCVKVSDGDTITVLTDQNQEIRIRLYGIDCPEKHQDFGTRAKQFTSNKVFGKIVKVQVISMDLYRRSVSLVYLINDPISLNEHLVENGLAWTYTPYCHDKHLCSKLMVKQEQIKNKKINIWSISDPIPPWEYRKHKKGSL